MSTGIALWKRPCQRKQVLNDYGTSLSRESKLRPDTCDHCSHGCGDQAASKPRLGLLPYAR
ncbi:rCG25287 [Rattus norvegicus]|uniref:RCG25287 n=1 Tax=Rattus norvegicus TaxID=10116 RepID=A6I3L7_RAT|nr:rCG25287 [Rattus norvegicus]